MCLRPISILNRSRFLDFDTRPFYKLDVPCGCCSDCINVKKNEYRFRTYYHALDYLSRPHSFIYFDTLTYSDNYLPHVRDFFPFVPDNLNVSCFCRDDVKDFIKRVRSSLDYYYPDSKLTYIYFSEFGTNPLKTRRPHYHILFFVDSPISPLSFSEMVSNEWYFGRTDGFGFRSDSYILSHNVITGVDHALRVSNYIAKYLQKDSQYLKHILPTFNFITEYVHNLYFDKPSSFVDSVIRKIKNKLFQRKQSSVGYGLFFFTQCDFNEIVKRPFVTLFNDTSYPLIIPLPQYYKRVYFYNRYKLDERDYYYINEVGVSYKNYLDSNKRFLVYNFYYRLNSRFKLVDLSTLDDLVDYCLNYRGRVVSDICINKPFLDLRFDLFNYTLKKDKEHFGFRFLSPEFLGFVDDYKSGFPSSFISCSDFINDYTYYDDYFEHLIKCFRSLNYSFSKQRQSRSDLLESIKNYHSRF